MRQQWGELFDHVISFGNIDFSRRWTFCFDNSHNNDLAVAKEIYINDIRVKAVHATKKFNILKIDWVPLWTNLDDLANIIKNVEGVNGQFVDSRWGRGDKISKDSTQVILRFYKDPNNEFNPPQYIHYYDDYNTRVFLHLTVIGQTSKCMRCNEEGHNISGCYYKFCYKCGKLVNKDEHICFVRPRNQTHAEYTTREPSPQRQRSDSVSSEISEEDNRSMTSDTNNTTSTTITTLNKSPKNDLSKNDTPKSNNSRSDEYIGRKVILGRGGAIKNSTPPSFSNPMEDKRQKTSPSIWGAIENKINFSSPIDTRTMINKLPPMLSPIKDDVNFPHLKSDQLPSETKTSTKIESPKGASTRQFPSPEKRTDWSEETSEIIKGDTDPLLSPMASETSLIDANDLSMSKVEEKPPDKSSSFKAEGEGKFFDASAYFG